MQEKNNDENRKSECKRARCFFNEVSFTIIALIMAAALTTYRYSADQPELFF